MYLSVPIGVTLTWRQLDAILVQTPARYIEGGESGCPFGAVDPSHVGKRLAIRTEQRLLLFELYHFMNTLF